MQLEPAASTYTGEVLPTVWQSVRALWAYPNLRVLALTRFLTQMTFYSTVIVAFQSGRGLSILGMAGFALMNAIFWYNQPA